jgi:sodium transport system ATP-binding protein
MVRCENISKHFSDSKRGVVKAVDDFSFEAGSGRIFGLLGVNGAGKTTVLRMLSTILKPTAGRAEVAGFDVTASPREVRASIGFLSTSTALYGRLSAREMLEYFGGLYGLGADDVRSKTNAIIDRLGIGSFADRLCDKLSTGQKQRVSIGRAILHDPPVLFFDEPTAGLDVVSSQTVMEFIEGARAQGKTVIFSTHIMSEAERLCDEIAVIHDGRLCAQGKVQDLKDQAGEPTLEKAFLKLVGYEPEAVLT